MLSIRYGDSSAHPVKKALASAFSGAGYAIMVGIFCAPLTPAISDRILDAVCTGVAVVFNITPSNDRDW